MNNNLDRVNDNIDEMDDNIDEMNKMDDNIEIYSFCNINYPKLLKNQAI